MTQYDRIMSLIGNNGIPFENNDEARKYFRVENVKKMFGECKYSQTDLDTLCETLIEGKEIEFADLFDDEEKE